MLAAVTIICSCPGRCLRAAQHTLLFEPAYLPRGKQIRELAQIDLCWRILVEDGERIGALAVVVSRRRHVSGSFCQYRTAQYVFRSVQVIGTAAFGIDQGL